MQAVPKEVIDPMIAQIPLRRMGEPEDIANAVIFPESYCVWTDWQGVNAASVSEKNFVIIPFYPECRLQLRPDASHTDGRSVLPVRTKSYNVWRSL